MRWASTDENELCDTRAAVTLGGRLTMLDVISAGYWIMILDTSGSEGEDQSLPLRFGVDRLCTDGHWARERLQLFLQAFLFGNHSEFDTNLVPWSCNRESVCLTIQIM